MILPGLKRKAAWFAAHNRNIKIYLDEMEKISPPSLEQDAILLKRIADGDTKAREELITRHAPQAFWIAVDRCNYYEQEDFLDVIQVATGVGLTQAVAHYKAEKAVPFKYFAPFWIQREIIRTLDKVRKSREKEGLSLDREAPGSDEGDQGIDLVEDLTALSGDQIYSQERVGKWVDERNKDLWKCMIKGLTNKHRTVLLLRYAKDLSYSDISHQLNIPIGTVGTILSRSKVKLRTMMEAKGYNQGFPSLS